MVNLKNPTMLSLECSQYDQQCYLWTVKKKSISTEIGQIFRQIRIEKGLSQEELAFKCNLHRTYIGSIERAEKVASIITLEKVAKALDTPLSEIIKKYENIKTERGK
jgi:ribosome-binding protein aMBF1 (putative translation factor)